MKSRSVVMTMVAGVLFIGAATRATTSQAETPLNGDQFDALTRGKIMDWQQPGAPWGREQYFRNQRVLWSDATGRCLYGQWHAEGDEICFSYEGDLDQHCWLVFSEGAALRAVSRNAPRGPVYGILQTTTPLQCPGPDVGM